MCVFLYDCINVVLLYIIDSTKMIGNYDIIPGHVKEDQSLSCWVERFKDNTSPINIVSIILILFYIPHTRIVDIFFNSIELTTYLFLFSKFYIPMRNPFLSTICYPFLIPL